MKDLEEMDRKELKAYRNIQNAAGDYIYSLENGCFDNPKDSQEYKDYFEQLNNFDSLVNIVYAESINTVYEEGCAFGGAGAKAYLKDIRFCGKEFLTETEHFVSKYQAEVLSDSKKWGRIKHERIQNCRNDTSKFLRHEVIGDSAERCKHDNLR